MFIRSRSVLSRPKEDQANESKTYATKLLDNIVKSAIRLGPLHLELSTYIVFILLKCTSIRNSKLQHSFVLQESLQSFDYIPHQILFPYFISDINQFFVLIDIHSADTLELGKDKIQFMFEKSGEKVKVRCENSRFVLHVFLRCKHFSTNFTQVCHYPSAD